MKKVTRAVVTALVLALGACGGGAPDATDTAPERGGSEAITIWTDRTELFFEHPPMIAGVEGDAWAIHFTDVSDFQAVTEGRLTLDFQGPDGRIHTTTQEAPARAGVYNPAPTLPSEGMYDLVVLLEGEYGLAGEVASEEDLPQLPPTESVGISFLKEQQWPIDFRTVPAARRVVAQGLEATGQLEPAPGNVAEVTFRLRDGDVSAQVALDH